MTDSYSPTYWVDSSTPAINAANLRKIEKGVADAHGIVDATLGSTGEVDRSVVKDGAGHYLKLPALTTAERDALTPATGMLIYNSTLGCLQAYRGSAWVDVHAGSVRDDLNLDGSKVTNVGSPTEARDAATKEYVDLRPAGAAIAVNAYLGGASWYRTDPSIPAWIVEVDAETDLCRFRRAPPGLGEISWVDVCQIGPAGLTPRYCVASNEVRYQDLAAASGALQYNGTAVTLKTIRIPQGQLYYLADQCPMSVRVAARLSQSTPYPDPQIIRFWINVDGVRMWTSQNFGNGEAAEISVDVPVKPRSTLTLGGEAVDIQSGGYYAAAICENIRVLATDVFGDGEGW